MRIGRNAARGWTVVLALVALITSSCSGGGDAAPAAGDPKGSGPVGTLRFAGAVPLVTFDAHRAPAGVQSAGFLSLVYDGLVTSDGEPALASSWDYVDDTTLVFELRDDVSFLDGTRFDAAAAKANLERAIAVAGPRSQFLAPISAVEATDAFTLTVSLSRQAPTLIGALGSTAGMMISPAAFDNDDLDRNPVGTGPYVFDAAASTPGEIYRFSLNDDYFDPSQQGVEAIEHLVLVDPTARVNALQSGQVDLAVLGPNEAAIAESAGFGIVAETNTSFGLNFLDRRGELVPELADPRVRRAIGYAVDRDALVDVVALGRATPESQPFAEGELGFNPALDDSFTYDPDKARELLAEAGVDGFSFAVPAIPDTAPGLEAVQGYLRDVGIDMRIELVVGGALGAAAREKTYAVSTIAIPNRGADERHIAIWSRDAQFNPFRVEEPELEQLAARAAATRDEVEREQLFADYAQILVEDAIVVVFLHLESLAGYDRDKVTGVEMEGAYPVLRGTRVDG